MGTVCRSKWRENDEKERIWVIEPSHPIASGLPEYIEIPEEETYGERFELPVPIHGNTSYVFNGWINQYDNTAFTSGTWEIDKNVLEEK